MKNEIIKLISEKAEQSNLDKYILIALAEKESSFNPKAMRFETTYKWVFEVNKNAKRLAISQSTELTLQKFSYGLFQVMGGVIRELGFTGHLTDTLDVNTNIDLAIKKILLVKKRFPDLQEWLSAYNAGTPTNKNIQYVNYVIKQAEYYRKNLI